MATWITHLMIADALLQQFPQLHRRGFCMGSIAPDCNVENADWTAFIPPREVTHWMQGTRKQAVTPVPSAKSVSSPAMLILRPKNTPSCWDTTLTC